MDNEFLDFDEAVTFLKTTPSTLYKWLQAGKIPGHKLGRQWRFSREELQLHLSGQAPKLNLQKQALEFSVLLEKRKSDHTQKELKPMNMTSELSEKLIWDAFDHGSTQIHLAPDNGKYEIRYRTKDGFEQLTKLDEPLFRAIDENWQANSAPIRDPNMRRLYMYRGDKEVLHVRYQRLETITGPHVTLRLHNNSQDTLALEKLKIPERELGQIKNWLSQSHGLIVVCGPTGSGKTTTLHAMMREMRDLKKVVFSLEDPADQIISGICQVELSETNAQGFEKAFSEIYNSDPDVIFLGLGSYLGYEKSAFLAAQRAARTGHLVVMQVDAESAADAMVQIEKVSDQPLGKNLIGVCFQKLAETAKGQRTATYELSESKT